MLRYEFKCAFMNLRKHKVLAIINLIGLSVGMTCSSILLLHIYDEMTYENSHENADFIYRVVTELNGHQSAVASAPLGPTLQRGFPEITNSVRIRPPWSNWLVSYKDQHYYEEGFFMADSTVFDIFTLQMAMGDARTALSRPNTVVLTRSIAEKYFGNENPLGKVLMGDGHVEFEVTGVMDDMPRKSHLQCDFLASLSTLESLEGYADLNNWYELNYYTYLLLKDDSSKHRIEGGLSQFVSDYVPLREHIKVSISLQKMTRIHLHSNLEREIVKNEDIESIYIYACVVVLTLMIALFNFTNMFTVIGISRLKEIYVRRIVGCSRIRIVIGFVVASLFFAILSAVITVVSINALIPTLNILTGKNLTLEDYNIIYVLLLLGGGMVLVCTFSGIVMTLNLTSFLDLRFLKGKPRVLAGGSWLQKCFIVIQFMISITLITSAGILYDQISFLRSKPLGFDRNSLVYIPLTDLTVRESYRLIKNQVTSISSVNSATISTSIPSHVSDGLENIRFENRRTEQLDFRTVRTILVDHDFLSVFKLDIIAGRSFLKEMDTDDGGALVINKAAVKQFGWESPETAINSVLKWRRAIDDREFEGTVIGVVDDFHLQPLSVEIEPTVLYINTNWWWMFEFLTFRIEANSLQETVASLHESWKSFLPNYPFVYFLISRELENMHSGQDRLGTVISTFAIIAVFISIFGLIGLTSFNVKQRVKEIAVRKILGSTTPSIISVFCKEYLGLLGIAYSIAFISTYVIMTSWLETFAYRVNIDLVSLALLGGIAVLIAMIPVFVIVYRTSSVVSICTIIKD